jgi:cold shock CspA family protein
MAPPGAEPKNISKQEDKMPSDQLPDPKLSPLHETGASPEQNYGFILGADGDEIYFHRNSVAGNPFEKLAIGDEVRFIAQHSESAKGLQASTVIVLGKRNPH